MANKEAIQKWADALRYGDLPQTRGGLIHKVYDLDADALRDEFCGLGVACKVYAEEHGIDVVELVDHEKNLFENFFPVVVESWLGLDPWDAKQILTFNDIDEWTLPQIGDWVNDNLLKDE